MKFLVICLVILMLTACVTTPWNKCEFENITSELEVETKSGKNGEVVFYNSAGPQAQADTVSILKKNTEVRKYPDGKDRAILLEQGQYTIVFKKQCHYTCSIDIKLPKGHIITIENVKLKPKPICGTPIGGMK